MANVGFGITQLDILGTGTPIIESITGNLELKSNEIKVGTGVTISSGIVTATSFVKSGGTSSQYLMADGSTSTGVGGATGVDFNGNVKVRFGTSNDLEIYHNGNHSIIDNTGTGDLKLIGDDVVIQASNDETMAKFIENGSVDLYHDNSKKFETTSSGISVTGIVSATSFSGSGNDIVTSRWTLGANGSSDYTFTGPGGLSGTADPKLYLARGQTYEFVNNSGGSHPFQIQQSNGTAYNTGVTNNGAASGTITFAVPFSAPNTLQYKCTSHGSMGNTIIVYPDLSP